MEPETTNQQPEQQTPQQRNFPIPGCSVVIQREDDAEMTTSELLAIVFQLAGSNPDAKVDFWIKVTA
ncbi:MAG TPA: hypothetical protein V6D10_07170 [Trichocoleus sp.]|jgi:hypothetical protein